MQYFTPYAVADMKKMAIIFRVSVNEVHFAIEYVSVVATSERVL